MRLLILGVSALSLGACSVGGVGFGHGSGGYGYGHTVGQAQTSPWSSGQWSSGHSGPGYAQAPCGYDPCANMVPAVAYAPPPPPVYQPPVYQPPVVHPAPPQQDCFDPCSATYAVSPYAHGSGQTSGYGPAYVSSYGLKAPGYTYGTLGAVYYDTDQASAGLQGRFGYQSASILGAELEGSIGLLDGSEDFTTVNGVATTGEVIDSVDYSVAAFATARAPLGNTVSAHARLGYHNTKTSRDFEFDNGEVYESSDMRAGLAYGAGLQFDVTPVDGLRLDVTRYEGGEDDLDTVSLAYLRRF